MIADHIGIISNGKLGYEGEVHKDADLERIFMEVVCPGEKSGMQNIVFRPIRFNKIWLGKRQHLRGLGLGADDYITKPFGTDELRISLKGEPK